jgi:hypothetical protein
VNTAATGSRDAIVPTNTAWATGGNAQPSGTVVTAVGTVVVVDVVVDVVLVLVELATAGASVVVVVSALTSAGALKPRISATREVTKMARRIDSTLLTESPCRTAVVQRY